MPNPITPVHNHPSLIPLINNQPDILTNNHPFHRVWSNRFANSHMYFLRLYHLNQNRLNPYGD